MRIFCAIIILSFMLIDLGISLAKHGEPTNQKYDFWVTLIVVVIEFLLFWGAGIFDCFSNK